MLEVYLNFNGNASEAIELYKKALNATDIVIMKYKDAPKNPNFLVKKEMEEKIIHGEMLISGVKFNFSDLEDVVVGNNVNIAIKESDKEFIKNAFDILSEDGKVIINLGATFFSEYYANVIDKYGNIWQLVYMK